MNELDGRVAVVTGAGRGIGREHALLFAAEGAKVVVNDLGGATDGTGSDASAAEAVVEEIRAAGGEAVANHDDVASWDGAERLIATALDTFGDLHVLVNNAGVLRDRMMVNLTEDDWDTVVRVNLKGHFCTTRWAGEHWRSQSKAGVEVRASVINTSSGSGLLGIVGQTNYGAAKMGVAGFTMIAAEELGRYGVRMNAIAPVARTRLNASSTSDEGPGPGFDDRDPGNVSPFVAYLATEGCAITGRVFLVVGGEVHLFQPWSVIDKVAKDGRWTIAELRDQAARLGDTPFQINNPLARGVSSS